MAIKRAIVAGAGMGGLSAAIALRDAGFDVVVFERMKRFLDVGAFSLWTNAMLALKKLGVADAVTARGAALTSMEIRNSRGRLLKTFPLGEIGRRCGAPTVGVHRADLQAALAERLGKDLVQFGAECVGFEEHGSHVVARLADGRTEQADLLIGADGIQSKIRVQLLGDEPPHYPGFTCWRSATKPRSGAEVGPTFVQLYGRGAAFGLFPIAPGTVCWYGTKAAPEGGARRGSPAEWRRAALQQFGDWWAPVAAVIEGTDDNGVVQQDIYDRDPIESWSRGRVVLLGDAAHPAPPTLGQGGCMAIEDAVVLGRCLRNEADIPTALRAFVAARVGRTSMIVRQARRQGALVHSQSRAKAAMRNTVLKLMPEGVATRQLERLIGFDA